MGQASRSGVERSSWRTRAAFLSILLVAPCRAPADWAVTGQVGGPTTAIAVQGSTAYAGVGYRLLAYDVTDPAAPRLLGTTASFADFVLGVAIAGTRAYVAAGSSGLHVVDISDPSRMSLLGSWDSPGSAEGVAISGSTAYLADGPFGLRALDVSDPARPRPLGSAFDTKFAFDVALGGGFAFVAAAGAGLLVADVGDPSRPVEVATLATEGFARSVVLSGTTAFVAAQWGGVRVVSVSDPVRPREVGSVALPSWAFGVAVSGSTLYVADGSQGLRVLDVSSPAAPREVGAFPITWAHTGGVVVADGRAYVAVRGTGFHVVDVRDAASPRALGVVTQLAEARAAVAVGDLAYVAAAEQGLRVLDLSAAPREVGAALAGDFSYCVALLGQKTLVVGSTGIKSPGVYFFDLADPRSPRALSVVADSRISPTDVVVEGSLVAISGEPGIHLIDASDPAKPAILSYLELWGAGPLVEDVALSGGTACVAQSEAGLRLVDVTDARSPKIVGTYKPATLAQAQAVTASKRTAYVAGGSSPLHVVDISDPSSPRTLSVLPLAFGAERMRLSGTTLFVASGVRGIVTVDVSDPSNPKVTGSRALPGYTFGVGPAGSRLFACAGEVGLFVLEASAAPPVAGPPSEDEVVGIPADSGIPWRPADRIFIPRVGAEPESPGAVPACRTTPLPAARTVVVKSTAESGTGTLREALSGLQAGDTVTFDPAVFPPSAPATIRLATQLPGVAKDGVTLDASSAGVAIDGTGLPVGSRGLGLDGNDCTVMGLQITGFYHSAIAITGSRNVIGGDRHRGTGPTGQGNVLSGNRYSGVNFLSPTASGNRVVGNLIGTDATGTRPLGEQMVGVFLFPGGPGNVVGGTEPWQGNVISGNSHAEVFFQQARGNTVVGNLIGTDPTGTRRVGSAGMGLGTGGHSSDNVIRGNVIVSSGQAIIISDSGSYYNQIVGNRIGVGTDGRPPVPSPTGKTTGVAVSQSYNRIAENVISGNTEWGIQFGFWGSHDSVITGNRVGTDPSGTSAVPNGRPAWGGGGIRLMTLVHGFVGGTTDGERNVISGSDQSGISLSGPGPTQNFVLGNLVGTDATGLLPLGNGKAGVEINAADGNFVQENVLASNGWVGIWTGGSAQNRFRRNSTYGNTGGGISAGPGSERLPPVPAIATATHGKVTGSACAGCTVEIFSDLGAQSRLFEGETVAGGGGSFDFSVAGRTLTGPNVTATATDAAGSTSALSAAAKIAGEDPSRLLLLGRKVSARVSWRNQYDGSSGIALPVPKGDQFGFFTFTDPANPEVFVKALDFGPERPYLLFWAGLTDLEYTVTFTNAATGRTYAQTKPAYSTSGGADTANLPHVGAVFWDPETGAISEVPPGLRLERSSVAGRTTAGGDAAGELVLDEGQIGVTVAWRSQYSGETGAATPLPQDDQFGFFHFGDAGNPEVFVKALDWGASRPFLLFAAGLSDFEYTVKFRNRRTGQEVSFTKPASSFAGFADGTSMTR